MDRALLTRVTGLGYEVFWWAMGPKATDVQYALEVGFGFLVPKFVAKKLTEVSLPKMFDNFEVSGETITFKNNLENSIDCDLNTLQCATPCSRFADGLHPNGLGYYIWQHCGSQGGLLAKLVSLYNSF